MIFLQVHLTWSYFKYCHILHQQFCITIKQINFSKLHICETKDFTFLKAATIPYTEYRSWFKRPIFFLDYEDLYVNQWYSKKYQTELLTLRRYCSKYKYAIACKMALVIHAYLRWNSNWCYFWIHQCNLVTNLTWFNNDNNVIRKKLFFCKFKKLVYYTLL